MINIERLILKYMAYTEFKLEDWNDPRSKIAFKYKDDGMGYITHAAWCVSKFMHLINKPNNELLNYTLLDYGCGTGRMSRLFSFYFKEVIAYDPNKECIEVAKDETEKTNKVQLKLIQENLSHSNNIEELIKTKNSYFDYVFCMSVFEHLNKITCGLEFDRIKQLLKPNGVLYIDLHSIKNQEFIISNKNELINVQKQIDIIPYYKYKNGVGHIQMYKYKNIK